MKQKLNLHERFIFINLLPREENFTTLRIVRDVKKEIGITNEEYKCYNIVPGENGRVSFNAEKAQEEKEFEIGDIALQLVKTALEKLDKEKKLTEEHFSLYEKFIEKK